MRVWYHVRTHEAGNVKSGTFTHKTCVNDQEICSEAEINLEVLAGNVKSEGIWAFHTQNVCKRPGNL